MNEIKQQVPEWLPERFFNNIKADLESNGKCVLQWAISKTTMIATLNYIRNKGYKCEWIEKGEQLFDIKITTPPSP